MIVASLLGCVVFVVVVLLVLVYGLTAFGLGPFMLVCLCCGFVVLFWLLIFLICFDLISLVW